MQSIVSLNQQTELHMTGPCGQLVAATKMYSPFHRFFTKMPSEHYMVEGHLLLGAAAEDIPHADEIRTILKV
jgi:hypothetical protein